ALSVVGLAVLSAMIASFVALAYFYRVMAARETEHTAQTPPHLVDAVNYLRNLPGKAVLVLPTMYADFVAYNAGKPVVWGGHSGDLRKFEEFFPVIRKPFRYFLQQYEVDYVLLDLAYTTPSELQADDALVPLRSFGCIAVYETAGA